MIKFFIVVLAVFSSIFLSVTPMASSESLGEPLLISIVNTKGGGDVDLYEKAITAAGRMGVLKKVHRTEYESYITTYLNENIANYKSYDVWRTFCAMKAAAIENEQLEQSVLSLLYDYDFAIGKTGSTSYGKRDVIYSLLTLDGIQAVLPESYEKDGSTLPVTTTRLKLVNIMYQLINSDGSYGEQSYSAPDYATTALAALALYPYAPNDVFASEALTEATAFLAQNIDEDGGYISTYYGSTISTSYVCIALCAMGIDPSSDRTTSNEAKILSYYKSVEASDGYFAERGGEFSDKAATVAALSAMNAYARFKSGKNAFFDFAEDNDGNAIFVAFICIGVVLLLLAVLILVYQIKVKGGFRSFAEIKADRQAAKERAIEQKQKIEKSVSIFSQKDEFDLFLEQNKNNSIVKSIGKKGVDVNDKIKNEKIEPTKQKVDNDKLKQADGTEQHIGEEDSDNDK